MSPSPRLAEALRATPGTPAAARLAERGGPTDEEWPAILEELRKLARAVAPRFRDVASEEDILAELALCAYERWIPQWTEGARDGTERRSLQVFLRDRLRDHLREERRKLQRRRELVATRMQPARPIFASSAPQPEEVLATEELRASSPDPEALALREAGYSGREIAATLGTSAPTVSRRLALVGAALLAAIGALVAWVLWPSEPEPALVRPEPEVASVLQAPAGDGDGSPAPEPTAPEDPGPPEGDDRPEAEGDSRAAEEPPTPEDARRAPQDSSPDRARDDRPRDEASPEQGREARDEGREGEDSPGDDERSTPAREAREGEARGAPGGDPPAPSEPARRPMRPEDLARARGCLMLGDNQCVVRALEGRWLDAEGLRLLIEALRAQGRTPYARSLMQEYVGRFGSTPQGRAYAQILSGSIGVLSELPPREQAMVCAKEGNHACVVRVLAGRARDARALAVLVDAYLALGRTADARRNARDLLERWPEHPASVRLRRQLGL